MEFRHTVDPMSDEPIMLINKHIGFDDTDGPGIEGSSFQSELLALDAMGKKRIQVWINSPGGSVIEGMSIYNAILKSRTKVDTYCAGIAASIAGVIFQAGRNRVMSDYGLLMYHNPYNPDGRRDEGLEKIKGSLVAMIAGRSGKPEAEVSRMMDRTTWITANEAVNSGMADIVEASSEYNKKRLVQAADLFAEPETARAFWKESNMVLNNLFDNKNRKMIKVANKLGLQPEANEEAILNAVTEVQNKLAAADAKNKENEDKILNLEIEAEAKVKEVGDLKNQLDSLSAELEAKKAEAEKAIDERKTAEATEMVKNFAKIGKIKDSEESVSKWVAKANEDFEGTKALLEELPLNKKSPDLGEKDDAEVKPYNMAAQLIEIQNKSKQQ